jgi:hypothetical protein
MKQATDLAHANIERLAYELWQQRGRRFGSPQEDWFRAERELLLVDRRSYLKLKTSGERGFIESSCE